MSRFLNSALLGTALLIPLTMAPTTMFAAEKKVAVTFHDKQHNDDHQWNANEDKAYRVYVRDNHRKSVTFSKLPDNDQQAYWGWRHEHSDALLKINIR